MAEAKGFEWVRASGYYDVFRHSSGKIIVIPDHGAQVIVRPLLRKILRDLGVSPEEYTELLKNI